MRKNRENLQLFFDMWLLLQSVVSKMWVFFNCAASVATQLWMLVVDVEIKSPVLRSAGRGLRKGSRGVFLLVVEEPALAANPIRSVGRYLTFA